MVDPTAKPDIAVLMAEFRAGSNEAASRLVDLFQPELRRIAAGRMRQERLDHTLQATALVNELYLELLKIRRLPPGSGVAEAEKLDFLRLSNFLMRRLLIHHARPLSKRVTHTELVDRPEDPRESLDVLADIDRALTSLGEIDPKLREVVVLKLFEDLTHEEIAVRMNCSVRSVTRHWTFAQHWLQTELAALMTG